MPRFLTLCLLCLMPSILLAAELDGRYLATLDGLPAEMILHSQGQQVKGQYMENDRLRLIISGSCAANWPGKARYWNGRRCWSALSPGRPGNPIG